MQAALSALHHAGVVLLGGCGKPTSSGRLGFALLARQLKQHHVLCFGASATEICGELQECGISDCGTCSSLQEAVRVAREVITSSAGLKIVLLSPGCASFDEFQNFSERGDSFAAYVKAL
jgi:UDP-N-acetylmuramoylalanine--D-glutamate ligase